MKKELLFIHHSHTDIGYTQRQEKITRYHADFIKQAIEICEEIENGRKESWKGFCWVCENTWQVEQFLQNSSEKEKSRFKYFVEKGYIDISGNYLNMTELLDQEILVSKIKRGIENVSKYGKKPRSSMTADVNGYSWGYADALKDNGIENLFSCIHTHHGMVPLGKKQNVFYWESPKGQKVLTWVGDHYHIGNELCFMPKAGVSYTFRNDDVAEFVDTDEMRVAEARTFRYLEQLETEGYEYSFVPLMISGVNTDNAPPNGKIMDFINQWNKKYGDKVPARMISLDEFFIKVRSEIKDIPTYKGDFNDWWADGVGSTMLAVKNFREGQRNYHLAKKLQSMGANQSEELKKEAEDELLLYAEHTWGYSASVSEPWTTLVNDLDLRKTGNSINGAVAAAKNLDYMLEQKGQISISSNYQQKFKIFNPHEEDIKDIVILNIDYWEYILEEKINAENFDKEIEIVDDNGNLYKSQAVSVARGIDVEVLVELRAREERILMVRKRREKPITVPMRKAKTGAEGISDIKILGKEDKNYCNEYEMNTEHYTILLDCKTGIKDIIFNKDNKSLLNKKLEHPAFSGIYEYTNTGKDPVTERRIMGRNRKSMATKRFLSKVKDIKKSAEGALFTVITISFELEGTNMYDIHIKAYHHLPKVDFNVRIHKTSCWNPENLYISLPFSTNEEEELWIEKAGCIIRPGIDQLPYSNMEFYLLQDGVSFISKNKTISLALKDVPLITFDPIESHPIILAERKDDLQHRPLYSWVMNNYWETNFKVDLSGFYEFKYTMHVIGEELTKEKAITQCKNLNQGLIGIRIDPKEA